MPAAGAAPATHGLAPGGGGESSNSTISARLGIGAVYSPGLSGSAPANRPGDELAVPCLWPLSQHREVGRMAEAVDHPVAGHAERSHPAAVIDRRLHGFTPDQGGGQARVERIPGPG